MLKARYKYPYTVSHFISIILTFVQKMRMQFGKMRHCVFCFLTKAAIIFPEKSKLKKIRDERTVSIRTDDYNLTKMRCTQHGGILQ
jgi:hypothetical protein